MSTGIFGTAFIMGLSEGRGNWGIPGICVGETPDG